MARDINLTSRKWNDIVFEDRPKDYGAYDIRLSSSRRHLIAFVFIVVLVIFVALLPKLIETVKSFRPATENLDGDSVLANITPMDDIDKQDEIVQQAAIEPPPALKSTIQFVAPVIVDDEEITEENQLKTQDEVMKSDAQVGIFNVEGTDEEFGVDLGELLEHQEIAGVVQEEIFEIVQQKAQFPGGLQAMYDYLGKNLHYPQNLVDNGIKGTVTVKFAVMSDGTISNISAVSSPDPLLTDEALKVIRSMPKWLPGMQNGKAVSSYFYLPVVFETH